MEGEKDKALELVKHGSSLLFLDVPQFTLIGIDTQVFSAGPIFKGIKMIPPGLHFVFYSSSNRDGKEFSPIIGFFIDTSPSEVVVRKWNIEEERLVKVPEEEVHLVTIDGRLPVPNLLTEMTVENKRREEGLS